jgi:ribosome-binding ATPase YchF (GTP1/OBG family)
MVFMVSIGIVGKPNTGKSTFFSSATLAPVEIGNYPFTTIKPNRGIGYVRIPCVCKEFQVKDNPKNSICLNGIRLIPVELIDCAGLVPGAWEGRGLGNQFLDAIRKADALIHVIDMSGSTDSEGRNCQPGEHDPETDILFLEHELGMWLTNILKRDWVKNAKAVEAESKNILIVLEERLSGLSIERSVVFDAIKQAEVNPRKPTSWRASDFINLAKIIRKMAKPIIIAANKMDISAAKRNFERFSSHDCMLIPCSAESELALRRAAEKQLISYLPGDSGFKIIQKEKMSEKQLGALEVINKIILTKFGSTGVQETINRAFFELLNMIVIYPVEDSEHLSDHQGNVLPDAYLVRLGTTARQLAYLIHSELGDNFIHAIDVRRKIRIGENYVLKDGDVISIISSKRRS